MLKVALRLARDAFVLTFGIAEEVVLPNQQAAASGGTVVFFGKTINAHVLDSLADWPHMVVSHINVATMYGCTSHLAMFDRKLRFGSFSSLAAAIFLLRPWLWSAG
jgi:hypothetical protein